MSTILTSEERTEARQAFNEALEQMLVSDATAVAFIVVCARDGEKIPASASWAKGHANTPAIMAGLTAELLALGLGMGVSPMLATMAINAGREWLDSDEEAAPATEVPQ